MAIRALIIAIENYGQASTGGLVSKLEGTTADAEAFRDWLLSKKVKSAIDIALLKDPTKSQICDAFRNLVDAGRDDTEELYVFYSGHGFCYTDSPMQRKPADVLVGSEFKNLQDSGDACVPLNTIQYALFQSLGPGNHFYFVDACRNTVSLGKVNPGGLGWTRDASRIGQPEVFTLFSTARGNVATVRSGFAPAVVDGLGGTGRAKRREGTEMWVSFDSLRRYLELRLAQKVDANPGGGSGRILKIDPIPNYCCDIEVTNADAGDSFTAVVKNAFQISVGSPITFQGRQTAVQQPPDDYFVEVASPQYSISPAQQPADLYDDCSLKFLKKPPLRAGAPPPPEVVKLSLNAPPHTRVELTNLRTGEIFDAGRKFDDEVTPGPYRVRLLEPGWTAVRDFRLLVDPRATDATMSAQLRETYRYIARAGGLDINVGERTPNELRDSLLQLIPGQHDSSTVDFSESLGPLANQDLSLWLSIIGASRIIGDDGQFSKLGNLPLASFDDVKEGDSPVYALIGLEAGRETIAGSVENDGFTDTARKAVREVPSVPGLYELRANVGPGLHIVNLKIGDTAAFATVAYTIRNRATLFTVARDGAGTTRIHQFILPLGKLRHLLSIDEQNLQPQNFLEAIRFTTLAQKQVSRLRPVGPSRDGGPSADPKLAEDERRWMDLLYGKWLDPVMAVMAAYELARSVGRSDEVNLELDVALGNLRKYFGELPDVELVAKIARRPNQPARKLPLFLAGIQALGGDLSFLPPSLPANKLDYTGPWVTWLGI
jgi:hypothetical protein